jgi:hypothetical protein
MTPPEIGRTMKHRPKSRAQMIAELQTARIEKQVILGQRVALMIVIAILHDKDGWTAEDLNQLVDDVAEYLDSYNAGNEDVGALVDNIRDELGIDLLGETL